MLLIAALPQPVFVSILMLAGLLTSASLVVAWATRDKASSQLRQQVNAWWLILPVVSLSLAIYPVGLLLLAGAIGLLAARELAAYTESERPLFYGFAGFFLVLATIGVFFQPKICGLILLGGLLFLSCRFFRWGGLNDLLGLLFLVLCMGLACLIALMGVLPDPADNLAWIFWLLVLTALNDVGQFIGGKRFGKYRIAPRFSPNKTWEGLCGGMLMSVVVAVVLGSYLHLAPLLNLLICGLLLSLAGFAGDLLFSAGKRKLGIKDFSSLIPGHGGMLDRVDSLALTAPLLCLILTFLY